MHNVYKDILLEGCRFLIDAQDNGVPFDKDRLMKSTALMQKKLKKQLINYINILL